MYSFRNEDLPEHKEVRSSLRSIWGVSWRKAIVIAARVGLANPFFIANLNMYNFLLLSFLLQGLVLSSVRLKRTVSLHIRTLVDSGSYRGARHTQFLPSRGQRTRTNANTCKKLRFKNLS